VGADLAWLHATGLREAIRVRAARGGRVLGICGGLQMLGESVEDAAGVDSTGTGLDLLPLVTVFEGTKLTRSTKTRFGRLPAPWTALSELEVCGYEIRHGRTTATAPVDTALPDGLGWIAGSVLGVTIHGLLEEPAIVAALVGTAPERTLEQSFEALADAVEEHVDVDALLAAARGA
jgi:adenosylcobyric acid synthase